VKGIIESRLQRLKEYDGNDDGADDNEMIFDEVTAEDKGGDQEEALENLFDENHLKQSDADREEPEQALLHARR
jgi:hypothetical protein